jgi:hypothetical protein
MVSTEVDFWNSAEVGVFSELLCTYAEFHGIPFEKYRGIPGKVHGIPEEKCLYHMIMYINMYMNMKL